MVWAACAAVAVFILLQFLVFPFFEKRDRISKGIVQKEKGIEEIILLSAEYKKGLKGARGLMKVLEKRSRGFNLFSFLERAAGKASVKDHIKYMKPSESRGDGPLVESMVEMKLEGVSLGQLVAYLRLIESPGDAVRVKRISIAESRSGSGFLDAVLQVITFRHDEKTPG
jgi:general secretion pathway protein M